MSTLTTSSAGGRGSTYRLTVPRSGSGAKAKRAKLASPVAPKPAAAHEPPKKEAPFVMEIFSGTKKAETKFENSGEGK